jgi:hypothetical protein
MVRGRLRAPGHGGRDARGVHAHRLRVALGIASDSGTGPPAAKPCCLASVARSRVHEADWPTAAAGHHPETKTPEEPLGLFGRRRTRFSAVLHGKGWTWPAENNVQRGLNIDRRSPQSRMPSEAPSSAPWPLGWTRTATPTFALDCSRSGSRQRRRDRPHVLMGFVSDRAASSMRLRLDTARLSAPAPDLGKGVLTSAREAM